MILLNGLPHFGYELARELNNIQTKHKFIFLNTYYSKLDKLLFFILLPFSKMVISFNGVSDKSNSLSWACFWKKIIIMQWHGTDVMLAIERLKNGSLNKKYILNATHFTDSEWLANELRIIIPNVKKVHFKFIDKCSVSHTYASIEALSYLGEGKEEFYGMDHINKLAQKNPEITFHIIGSTGKSIDKVKNIKFHGWVNPQEVEKLFKQCAIFIRLTKHDGFAMTILEALSYGCEVIWNKPLFENDDVKLELSDDALNHQFGELIEKIKQRNYKPNNLHIENFKTNFSKTKIIQNYYNELVHFLKN